MYRVRAEGDPAYLAGLYEGDPFAIGLGIGALKKIAGKLKRKGKVGLGEKLRGKFKKLGRGALKLGARVGVPGAGVLEGLAPRGKGMRGAGGRRMRVTNPKALRRALRRVTGFAKTVKRTKRAIAKAASAVGVRRGGAKRPFRRR